ncbi:MAG TPA: beta-galactosidase [Tepidisphaeraceae bacterium]|nr:beta-galactosidase [Tepidisphaeraceae bacterium]
MKIGTYYHAQHWPRQQWERDFDNIAAMKLRVVHLGQHAWQSLEPRPGEFQLDWLEQCLEIARQRKLEVILCTPTAAPPIWLAEKGGRPAQIDLHPAANGSGSVRSCSPTCPQFREAAVRIVTALAERFGQHPAVIGWQIDNQYAEEPDQSTHTHAAFRDWLRRKYGTIENLNQAWGCQWCNTCYGDFEQIHLPPKLSSACANPHQALDAQRFWSWTCADFDKLQAEVLKPRVADRFIATRFVPLHLACNPADMTDQLTVLAWDSYPVLGRQKNPTDEGYRAGDLAGIGLMHDLMASYRQRWALTEVHPAQANSGGVPVLLYPGAVRLWVWTAYAHGAEFVSACRYRQPRSGPQLFHQGLVAADGTTQTHGGREFVQVADELARLDPTKPRASRSGKAALADQTAVGLLFDFEQLWCCLALPWAKRWDLLAWIVQWYRSLVRLGLAVRIIHPDRPWPANLAMIVAPGVQMVDAGLVQRLDDFASSGGHVILTCRTGLMDRNAHLWEGPAAAPVLPLIGGTIEAYDCLPDECLATVEMDSVQYKWGVWADLLYAEPTTRVLAKYADQFYTGAAAVMQNRRGKGTVTYCGVYAEQAFTDALVEKVATAGKVPHTPLPPGVQMLRRGSYCIVLNYALSSFDAPAPRNARFLVGSRKVEPVGVAVWEE